MFKKFLSEYTIVYFAILFLSAVFLFLKFKMGIFSFPGEFFNYYSDVASSSAKTAALAFLTIPLWLLFGFLIRKNPSAPIKIPFFDFKNLRAVAKLAFLIAALLILISTTLSAANALNKNNLKDEMLLNLDRVLTGTFPFMFLHSIQYPSWFINFMIFSFWNITAFLLLIAFYIFYKNRLVFFKLLSAFSLGLIISLSVWLFLPALSPQDRFIDNVYKLPLPAQMASALKNYAPQEEIAAFLQKERFYKERLASMPTSTIPSAHVFWALILGYYLFKTNKNFFCLVAPVLFASGIGTVFFAQHYLVDIPAGIIVGICSIILTNIYFNSLKFYEKERRRA